MTREGLAISQEQIQGLWNLFDIQVSPEEESFDIKKFVAKYPHVNSSLTKKIVAAAANEDDTSTRGSSSSSLSLDIPSDLDEHILIQYSPIAEEAENKLQRMLDKIDQHDSLPADIQAKIQSLLSQELDTVLELWLRISSQCQTLQEAVAATDRATDLLLKFQGLHEKGVNLRSGFYPPPPSINNYQSIIHNYHELFFVNQSTFSLQDLKHFQSQSSKLIKGMTKRVLTTRMQSLQGPPVSVSNTIPLNDSYNHVISLYTNNNHDHNHTQNLPQQQQPLKSQTDATEMANASSKLLQQMELYYHDFHTLPSKTNKPLQTLLLSIHPTQSSFRQVIAAFVDIAAEFDCKYSIIRANDILDRMNKRFQAYEKESDSDSGGTMNTTTTMMNHLVVKPDLELYLILLKGYASMNSLSSSIDVERVAKVLESMEEDGDVIVSEEVRDLVKVIQAKAR